MNAGFDLGELRVDVELGPPQPDQRLARLVFSTCKTNERSIKRQGYLQAASLFPALNLTDRDVLLRTLVETNMKIAKQVP